MRGGARRAKACAIVGLCPRTDQRWRLDDGGEDDRRGPGQPKNKLNEAERAQVLEVANSPEFRDCSPKQIVPTLADRGTYIASESTFYRVLREEGLVQHRERSRPPSPKPTEHVATGPNQVWSWDITYMASQIQGKFYFLYLIIDVWSRKIVGWRVHEREDMGLASNLISAAARAQGIKPGALVLHSDNGSPMRGCTMRVTLERLGIIPSFSRPRVSDDNPFPESLFKTMKNRPEYPRRPFRSPMRQDS